MKRGTLFCWTNIVGPLPQVKPLSMLESALLIALVLYIKPTWLFIDNNMCAFIALIQYWDYHITYRVTSGIVVVMPPPLYF